MKKELMNYKSIRVIVILALFNFIFLGTEYMFDNMMANVTDSKGVVAAQSYILGASVIGFIFFPIINRFIKEKNKFSIVFATSMVSIICIFIIKQHTSYKSILISGLVIFVILGIVGSAVHYIAACALNNRKNLAKTVGMAYGVGILLQFINNNFINNDTTESMVLWVFLVILLILMVRIEKDKLIEKYKKNKYVLKNPLIAGVTLIIMVALMTCIFATLDNAVTLVHATGNVDIGQWPRLLLALSGLTAGFLFDIKKRRYMNIMMYCVTLLSTACVVVMEFGGPFLIGLIVFYLSAGFFAVFFTASFMDLSYYMNIPEFWAGLGRAINNAGAVITGALSVTLLTLANNMAMTIIALFLFMLISVTIFIYSNQLRINEYTEDKVEQFVKIKMEDEEERFSRFSEVFSLTAREKEVLKILLSSDESAQDIADQLFISRAALYRHIGCLNEKTKTKSRIGLLQFYYTWNEAD